MKVMVYVPLLTPRIKYIFGFIFNDILKTDVGFTVNAAEFMQSDLPKFCYAPQPIADTLFFKSSPLLLEHKITEQQIRTTTFGGTKVPFAVEKSTLPFDVFAASFYFLSRYEEYLPGYANKSSLYLAERSLQYKLNLLKTPIIDGWALLLKNILLKQFPSLSFGPKQFSFNPVYAFPPTDKESGANPIVNAYNYFKLLIGKIRPGRKEKLAGIRQLIAEMQQYGQVKNQQVLITSVGGQHLFDAEMQIPRSYIKKAKTNTGADYSMHYGHNPGFRAGTCTPFQWYDLQIEKITRLMVHPVAATDTALLGNKTSASLLLQMNELLDSVKLVNGHFYFLSLCNDI